MPFSLFVFDLDFTLWDAGGTWCDCTNPPYRKKNGIVYDSHGMQIKLYADVYDILNFISGLNKQIAVASRTTQPSYAQELMHLFGIDTYFHYREIFPARKIEHFNKIAQKSGINYNQMIFFDDELRNIEDVSSLGVESILVPNGISKNMIMKFI